MLMYLNNLNSSQKNLNMSLIGFIFAFKACKVDIDERYQITIKKYYKNITPLFFL